MLADYEVTCDDNSYGVRGLQVAATSQAMFMGAISNPDTRLWALYEDGVNEPDDHRRP